MIKRCLATKCLPFPREEESASDSVTYLYTNQQLVTLPDSMWFVSAQVQHTGAQEPQVMGRLHLCT